MTIDLRLIIAVAMLVVSVLGLVSIFRTQCPECGDRMKWGQMLCDACCWYYGLHQVRGGTPPPRSVDTSLTNHPER